MNKILAICVTTIGVLTLVSCRSYGTATKVDETATKKDPLTISQLQNQEASSKQQMQNIAKQKMQQFGKQLISELLNAIGTGGFESAVEVCQQQAPKIAAELSTNGWTLSRTSLKTRNTDNQPNEWQKEVLVNFEQQLKQGEAMDKLVFSDIKNGQFRMMKAIPTGQLCVACHGTNISSDLREKINQHYPQDTAINFSLNDIRGAFSVTAPMSE
ncbi:DUF3365 domain-containing protein [Aliiglaciecola sp. SL4]|uniref:Tll0287-like domain-containing protein n=1 Tax=Aliiglaciecola sp. SL4 TaxID=3239806 RepID=UPI00355B47EB